MLSSPIDYFISDKFIALKINENLELSIPLKKLRQACPCAHCNGEKDVFGNISGKREAKLVDGSLALNRISLVGSYAIRFFWKDGHSNGIYTFKYLKGLSD